MTRQDSVESTKLPVGRAEFRVGQGIEGKLHIVSGDVNAVVPFGVLVQVERIGALVIGDFPVIGQAGWAWASRADIATDQLLVDQAHRCQRGTIVRNQGMDGLDVVHIGVDERATGRCGLGVAHFLHELRQELIPGQGLESVAGGHRGGVLGKDVARQQQARASSQGAGKEPTPGGTRACRASRLHGQSSSGHVATPWAGVAAIMARHCYGALFRTKQFRCPYHERSP